MPATDLQRILAALSEGARVLRIHHIHWAADSIDEHARALQNEPPETQGLSHTRREPT